MMKAAHLEAAGAAAGLNFPSLSLADLTLNLRPPISFESSAFTAFSISSLFSVSAKANLGQNIVEIFWQKNGNFFLKIQLLFAKYLS
jgi:hypothetical protein